MIYRDLTVKDSIHAGIAGPALSRSSTWSEGIMSVILFAIIILSFAGVVTGVALMLAAVITSAIILLLKKRRRWLILPSLVFVLGLLFCVPGIIGLRIKDMQDSKTRKNLGELYYAAMDGDTDAIEDLLDSGAHPDTVPDSNGSTPLIAACYWDHAETAELLVRRGAAINRADHNNDTPLSAVLNHKNPNDAIIALRLIEHGADVNFVSRESKTPLILAAELSSAEDDTDDVAKIVLQLLERGADVNARDKLGETALMKACGGTKSIRGFGEFDSRVIRILLDFKADRNLRNKQGKTALQLLERMYSEDRNVIEYDRRADTRYKENYQTAFDLLSRSKRQPRPSEPHRSEPDLY